MGRGNIINPHTNYREIIIKGISKGLRIVLIVLFLTLPFYALTGLWNVYNNSPYWFATVALFLILIGFVFYFFYRLSERFSPYRMIVSIVLLSALLRALWIIGVNNVQTSDFGIYEELAASLAAGGGYAIDGPNGVGDIELYIGAPRPLPYTTAYRAPGAPLWGAFLYRLFDRNPQIFKLSNLLMGASVSLLIFLILKKTGYAAYGTLVAFTFAVSPSSIMATNLFGTETLFVFLLLLVTYLITESESHSHYVVFGVAGLSAAAAVLVRSLLWPTALAAIFAFLLPMNRRINLRRIAIYLLFFIIGLTPWTIRNWNVFGAFIPVCSNEGMFLARNSTRNVPEDRKTIEWHEKMKRWEEIREEAVKSREGYKIGVQNMMDMVLGGPFHIVKSLFNGARALFENDVEIFYWSRKGDDLSPATIFQFNALTMAFYLWIVITAVLGAVQIRIDLIKSSPGFLFFLLTFLFYTASHILLLAQPRYHFSLMPFVYFISAIGQKRLFSKV